ncbi:hypothetical protein [Enterococcus pallens]|uniref:Uncharacterized protein n=1 Tax=Enterococcus pallens ATCC BAA-351 TaxID=1158607 RepID=R2QI01_9ENTE|nr:hypothetical protein [Enterococcus pallens]EOH94818.1 hypothetical protein UAU_01740 [Enterococcus pallens ATCC BAA-351]EOU14863.1 hypothetical protein I588_04513 [Enterococcus pallens ATCC BAA-351]OJG76236.1 hypothetical protein RV10_GL004143 [Enterococcus pallens]
MNDQDLHDILEAISEKSKYLQALEDLGNSLGMLKDSLLKNGFSREEMLFLSATYMNTMFQNKQGG